MFNLLRTVIWASVFISLILIYFPAWVAAKAGVEYPEVFGTAQVISLITGTLGALFMLWCAFTFALVGSGTPAPFDPPQKLVTTGPYGLMRNPMYVGAATALASAALYFLSVAILVYTILFLMLMHLFIVFYEEPTLKEMFGEAYINYCQRTKRWGLF